MIVKIFGFLTAVLGAIPAIERILKNPAIARLMGAFVGWITKTEAEKAVDKVRDGIAIRKDSAREVNKAIKNARDSRTKALEDLINRP